jgi:hypothetical protein
MPSRIARFILLGAVLLLQPAPAQQAVAVAPAKYTYFIEYDTSGNPVYICRAVANQPTTQFSVQFGTLSSVQVSGTIATINFTSAHGFQTGYKIVLSGSATTTLNGIYRVVSSDPASTYLTINVNAVPPGGYTDLIVATDTALLTKPIWAINLLNWVGGNNISAPWTNGSRESYNSICANRAVDHGPNAVTFK